MLLRPPSRRRQSFRFAATSNTYVCRYAVGSFVKIPKLPIDDDRRCRLRILYTNFCNNIKLFNHKLEIVIGSSTHRPKLSGCNDEKRDSSRSN
jgi:hypothetical protein